MQASTNTWRHCTYCNRNNHTVKRCRDRLADEAAAIQQQGNPNFQPQYEGQQRFCQSPAAEPQYFYGRQKPNQNYQSSYRRNKYSPRPNQQQYGQQDNTRLMQTDTHARQPQANVINEE